jgi:TonB-linked SusC/RagA family outer membrane protein
MVPDVQALSEVVVIGYGTQERTDLTGSVASVNVADVKRAPVATLNEAIQGRMAGVSVTSSGLPGQTSNINIRGIGGLGANSSPLYVVDGLWVDNIRDFNPADIESVQVLKDAATTAIYGSRGANGVIIITTRRGKAGEPQVNVNAYAGIQNISKRWDLTNAREFAAINNMAYDNAGRTRMPGADAQFNPNIDTDWQDEMIQQGTIQDYNIGVSGGGQNSNFLISGGYFNQKGTIIGPSFERYSIRLNSGMTKGRVKLGQSALFTRGNQVRMNGLPFIDIARMLPTIPVYDPNETSGSGFGYGSDINYTFGTNPVALQRMQRDAGISNRFLGSLFADVSILNSLTYRLNVGLDYNANNNRLSRKFGRWSYNQPLDPAFLTETRGDESLLLIENTLSFDKRFGEHSLSAVAGYTEQQFRGTFSRATNRTYSAVPQYYFVLSAGSTNPEVAGEDTEWAKRSWLGRILYDYGDRYFLTASIRRDGSSRFDPENQWGTFGAASVGWRISKEAFFANVPHISNLKLRASYGLVGNDGLPGNYLYAAVINQNANYVLGGGQDIILGSTQTQLASTGIKWESRYTTNVGLDIGVLEDRITLSTDYYISTTKDALVNPLIPIYLGNFGGNPFVNLGELENRGFELALTYQENRTAFKYGATANLTTIKNKVLSLSQEGQIIPGGPHGGITRTEVGHPVGSFYLIEMDGIFQTTEEVTAHGAQPYAKPGDVRYKDANRDGRIDNLDRRYVGSVLPKLQYGLNLNGSYMNFDLTLFFQGVYGNKVWNGSRFWLDRLDDNGNYRRDLNPWTGAGSTNSTPRPLIRGSQDPNNATAAAENARANTTRWLEDGSYLRLKNVQLGYNLPANLVSRVKGLGSIRVYLTGQNVLTFTKYTGLDPETVGSGFFARGVDDGSFPNVRTFTGGIQVGF